MRQVRVVLLFAAVLGTAGLLIISCSKTVAIPSLPPTVVPTNTADPVTNTPAATPGYHYSSQWGTGGAGNGMFSGVEDVALNAAGTTVYVADSANNRIQEFSPNGNYLNQFGSYGNTGHGLFNGTHSVALDSSGNIYVADGSQLEQTFTPAGVFQTQWSICYAQQTIVDIFGNVYITDFNYDQVLKFTSAGTPLCTWGTGGTGNGQFTNNWGVAVNSAGTNVYVADNGNNRVEAFSPTGTYLTQWGSTGTGNGQFNGVSNITVDTSGNVFVSDGNNRIQKFGYAGNYLTQFGSTGSGNGQLDDPLGLAVDPSGNVYVADYLNFRIEVFAP